jgi:hypothetical protein
MYSGLSVAYMPSLDNIVPFDSKHVAMSFVERGQRLRNLAHEELVKD